MDKSNLFERIEGYAQENFTTETLAYILEADPGVRKAFLDVLLRHQPGLRKVFRSCVIETQQSFDSDRPDMTITPTGSRGTKLFVEIKTQAHVPETRSLNGDGQIKRYLEHGHVAYLTPRGHSGPRDGADSPRYLGQFYWDQVYSAIRNRRSNNVLHIQFLEYLEARRMAPLKPISEDDLKASLHAAEVIQKFRELVDAVRMEIEPVWRDEFGDNIGLKAAASGVETGDLPYWWFRGSNWKGPVRRLFLCIGVYAKKGAQDRPRFYVELGTRQQKSGRKLEDDGKLRRLCRDAGWAIGWDTGAGPREWVCYKTFPVGKGSFEKIAKRRARSVRSQGNDIRKLVRFVGKKLATQ